MGTPLGATWADAQFSLVVSYQNDHWWWGGGVLNGEKEGHHLAEGDVILFASVGAGMNINAITYQI